MRRRQSLTDGAALTVPSYRGFKVGDYVHVARGPVSGRIVKLVMAPWWKFAVIEDDAGGSHAVGLDEL
jgi:hypothetical protein